MLHTGHETLAKLRAGLLISIDGLLVRMDGDGIVRAGDIYVGARNTVDIYTCTEVKDGMLWPEGIGYPFYTGEGVRVKLVDEGTHDYEVPAECLRRPNTRVRPT